MDKEFLFLVRIIIIAILVGGVFFILINIEYTKPYQFCEEKGYSSHHFNNIEEGYIQCCNRILIDHVYQDKKDCEVFEYG